MDTLHTALQLQSFTVSGYHAADVGIRVTVPTIRITLVQKQMYFIEKVLVEVLI